MLRESGTALMRWHSQTERDLPWRGETDPYRIWVSETMLQQTRAAVAAMRYREFLARFPDVHALANADEEDVLMLWQGLGYYARARNLHKAARVISRDLQGVFPRSVQELQRLPGIGSYTSCAICAMAYGQEEVALDANLIRVLSRFFCVEGYAEDNLALLREHGIEWLRSCGCAPGDFNRALMGMGALLCTAKNSGCDHCPIAAWCKAYESDLQEILPQMRPKAPRREEWHGVAFVLWQGKVLVRKRPEKGMLANLWEFPHFLFDEDKLTGEAVKARLVEEGCSAVLRECGVPCTDFTFTHKVWHLRAYIYEAEEEPQGVLADAEELRAIPMPSVMAPYREKALELLGK